MKHLQNISTKCYTLLFLKQYRSCLKPHKSVGLIGADAVEDHVEGAGQQTALARGARHGEGLTTSRYSICKEQSWDTESTIPCHLNNVAMWKSTVCCTH